METETRLARAIDAVPGWSGRSPTVEPLEGGITNRNYRVELDGELFVLRLAGKDTDLLGIDREAEVAAARAAASAGVAPEVVAWLPELGALVTRFVEGTHVPEADLEDEATLGAVVRSLTAIHSCPPIPATFDSFRVVEAYRALAAERGVPIPAAYVEAWAAAERIERACSAAPLPAVSCHNDLLNANFLRDGDHVWIVDYEYAGMGDPFFDLGNLSINNGLGGEAQDLLLRLIFGHVEDVHRARLGLMRVMSDFREAMWGVVQQAISSLEFDYAGYADRHFARLLQTAGDDRFEDWLGAARSPVDYLPRAARSPVDERPGAGTSSPANTQPFQ